MTGTTGIAHPPYLLDTVAAIAILQNDPAFRAFVRKQYANADQTIVAEDKLQGLLDKTQVSARNGAAHDGVLTQDDAKAVCQWAIEILSYV